MFGFDDAKDKHNEVYGGKEHESKLSHEVVAGGASFEAMRLFEHNQRKKGESVKHGFAKEVLAGLAGAEIDKLAETKGMDFADKEKAKYQAKQHTEHLYDQQYGHHAEYNPHEHRPHHSMGF